VVVVLLLLVQTIQLVLVEMVQDIRLQMDLPYIMQVVVAVVLGTDQILQDQVDKVEEEMEQIFLPQMMVTLVVSALAVVAVEQVTREVNLVMVDEVHLVL
tara:strand:+ start:120 stop:419 length:300 start_codon:yes stop_codon:yes gene_type:complete